VLVINSPFSVFAFLVIIKLSLFMFKIVVVPWWHWRHGEWQAASALLVPHMGGRRFSLFLPVFYARERKTLLIGFSSIDSSHYKDIKF
jgi:hypothetical protein